MENEDEAPDLQPADANFVVGPCMRERIGIMTPPELAAAFGVNVGTLKQWRYRKVGPPWTVAEHRVYYRYEDVQAYLAKNVTDPKA